MVVYSLKLSPPPLLRVKLKSLLGMGGSGSDAICTGFLHKCHFTKKIKIRSVISTGVHFHFCTCIPVTVCISSAYCHSSSFPRAVLKLIKNTESHNLYYPSYQIINRKQTHNLCLGKFSLISYNASYLN